MARLFTTGFEHQSATALVEIDQMNGTAPTISTTTKRSGAAAMRFNPSAATSFCRHQVIISTNVSKLYVRAYLYVATNPTAGGMTILSLGNSATTTASDIILNDDNSIKLWNGTTSSRSSDPMTLNTWNMIEMMVTDSSGGLTQARLNGVLFAANTGRNSANVLSYVWFGMIDSGTGDLYFDDIAVNDTTGSNQTSWPGAGSWYHAQPNGAGAANTFATAVGGTAGAANNYTRVSQVTPDDVTTYNGTTATGQEDLFTITTPTALTAGQVYSVVTVGTRHTEDAASASDSIKAEFVEKTGGAKQTGTAVVINSTSWITDVGNTHNGHVPQLTTYNIPDLSTTQIGYVATITDASSIRVSAVWLGYEIAISPLTNKIPTKTLRPRPTAPGLAR